MEPRWRRRFLILEANGVTRLIFDIRREGDCAEATGVLVRAISGRVLPMPEHSPALCVPDRPTGKAEGCCGDGAETLAR